MHSTNNRGHPADFDDFAQSVYYQNKRHGGFLCGFPSLFFEEGVKEVTQNLGPLVSDMIRKTPPTAGRLVVRFFPFFLFVFFVLP